MRIPEKFKERMRNYEGVDAEKLFASLEKDEPVKAFRVNNIKISNEDYLKLDTFASGKIPFSDNGFYTNEEKPGAHPYHMAGMIYMQDPSAQISVNAVDIKEGYKILDACASPGGKTTQASYFAGDSGVVVANEYVTKRCRILEENVIRLGCKNTVIVNLDTKYLAETYPEEFDLVICDAPCSGEGMFRKNIAAVEEWSLENVEMCAERQMEILENCAKCVKCGGYLLYSTCTFSLEENEMNVDKFLNMHDEFELTDVNERILEYTLSGINFEGAVHDMTKTRRFYPYISEGEGQFISLLKKKYSTYEAPNIKKKKQSKNDSKKQSMEEKEALRVADEFIKENMQDIPYLTPVYYNNKLYLAPDIKIPEFGVFTYGVYMGEVRKGRLIPSHSLFSALGEYFKRKVPLTISDERVEQYLNGHEIYDENAENGFSVVLLDGVPLGGVKVSNGNCKNYYLK